MSNDQQTAVVAGLGSGLGAVLCRSMVREGYRVAGLARSAEAGTRLAAELGSDRFCSFSCDVTDVSQVNAAIVGAEQKFGPISVYVHNAALFLMQPFAETKPEDFEVLWRTVCLGAVHGIQAVLPGMLERGRGVLLMIGATASVKASANFTAFGSAKFALRGLAQSLARELGPQGIHVAHLLIDGVIWSDRARDQFRMTEAQCLDPRAIAQTCLHIIKQDRSAWTLELDIRPDIENF